MKIYIPCSKISQIASVVKTAGSKFSTGFKPYTPGLFSTPQYLFLIKAGSECFVWPQLCSKGLNCAV